MLGTVSTTEECRWSCPHAQGHVLELFNLPVQTQPMDLIRNFRMQWKISHQVWHTWQHEWCYWVSHQDGTCPSLEIFKNGLEKINLVWSRYIIPFPRNEMWTRWSWEVLPALHFHNDNDRLWIPRPHVACSSPPTWTSLPKLASLFLRKIHSKSPALTHSSL